MARNESPVDPKRFLLAMVISAILLFTWQAYFAPTPPTPDKDAVVQETANQVEKAPVVEPVVPVQPTQPVVALKNIAKREDTLKTGHFELKFSNEGARLTAIKVLEPSQYLKAGDLLEQVPEDGRFPFTVGFLKDAQIVPTGAMYELDEAKSVKDGGTYSVLAYRYVDPAGQFVLTEVYKADTERPYELDLNVSIQNVSGQAISNSLTFDVFGYLPPPDPDASWFSSMLNPRPDIVEAICKTAKDIERKPGKKLESALKFGTPEDMVKWVGIDKRYFLFGAVSAEAGAACEIEVLDEHYLRSRTISTAMTIDAGQSNTHQFKLFVGPKDQDILDAAGSDLNEAIDYGMFAFLSRPMRWLLVFLFGFVQNWGFAIILLTIIVRLLMWPINHKVYANSERMKDIQPELALVKEKYANDQQRQAEETMKVFKTNGVSALGCAPMFLQFPIFLALYFMILNSVELYQANFAFWYTDLSAPDPYFVLPIAMGGVMLIQQSMMTVEAPNPQMKTIMRIMPITFTAFMLFLPSGVVLYYFASMLIGIIQQYMIKKQFAAKRAKADA